MSDSSDIELAPIRTAMAGFEISPRVEPNEEIDLDRVFFPDGHRSVLDVKRQLVVGNRGVGKSFWTHALTNPAVRERLARAYSFPQLAKTNVIIGFNGSIKISGITATIEEIQTGRRLSDDSELIWRAVILRAVRSRQTANRTSSFLQTLNELKTSPVVYAQELSLVDDEMANSRSSILIVFDALDRSSHDWGQIRDLTKGLLRTIVGLQSFRSIRAKVFMRVDQFADTELFRFPDSSKIRNDRVDLAWHSSELYGLLAFELMRDQAAAAALKGLARLLDAHSALPSGGHLSAAPRDQEALVNAIAGEFMGKDRKRGRVYTWVPLHLGDAANNCSPRTFLTAWKTAAEHLPSPQKQAVDHLGINEGVRRASSARLTELREDYPWIDLVLEPLRRQFVPIPKDDLFRLWREHRVTETILKRISGDGGLAPIGVFIDQESQDALLQTMTSIAVMEERANGKINVPDIFRVEAEILRKGGVAVPRRN
jgi:hypothetical protein